MLIGVLSDTHLPGGAGTAHGFAGNPGKSDLILHAGDFTTLSVLQRIRTWHRVKSVYGNVDSDDKLKPSTNRKNSVWRPLYRVNTRIRNQGHNQKQVMEAFPFAQCIIYGHSHVPGIEISGSQCFSTRLPNRKTHGCFSNLRAFVDKAGDTYRRNNKLAG
jgi:putative phosphoesterase